MATISKREAQKLLEAYKAQQTAATEAAILAYNDKRDARWEETRQTVLDKENERRQEAQAAYDSRLIQQLADTYLLQEQIANRGLTASGSADALMAGLSRQGVVADARHREQETAATAAVQTALLTAHRRAEADKAENAASARKTLQSKVAEKTLSLAKQTL